MEIGILDKSFICVIQPVIKALFGNADMTSDSDAVEYTLFYQIICCGTTDTQNVLKMCIRDSPCREQLDRLLDQGEGQIRERFRRQ